MVYLYWKEIYRVMSEAPDSRTIRTTFPHNPALIQDSFSMIARRSAASRSITRSRADDSSRRATSRFRLAINSLTRACCSASLSLDSHRSVRPQSRLDQTDKVSKSEDLSLDSLQKLHDLRVNHSSSGARYHVTQGWRLP